MKPVSYLLSDWTQSAESITRVCLLADETVSHRLKTPKHFQLLLPLPQRGTCRVSPAVVVGGCPIKYRQRLKNICQPQQTNQIDHFNQQPCWIQDGLSEAETDVFVLRELD